MPNWLKTTLTTSLLSSSYQNQIFFLHSRAETEQCKCRHEHSFSIIISVWIRAIQIFRLKKQKHLEMQSLGHKYPKICSGKLSRQALRLDVQILSVLSMLNTVNSFTFVFSSRNHFTKSLQFDTTAVYRCIRE